MARSTERSRSRATSRSATQSEKERKASKMKVSAIMKECSSMTFRPKTLNFENNLIRFHIGLAILAGIVTVVGLSSALLYRNAYKNDYSSDETGQIPQEQGRLMKWSQDTWILALVNSFLCFGCALCEYVSQDRVNEECLEVARNYCRTYSNDRNAIAADRHTARGSAYRKGLKKRFIVYILLGIGVLIGYFYLSLMTWNNGSHAEVKSWPKRRVPKYKNKGTSRQKQSGYTVKKVLQITHFECTEETLSYCSEIKQFNYSLIAATAMQGVFLLEMCYVVFCAYRASKRKELNYLRSDLNAGAGDGGSSDNDDGNDDNDGDSDEDEDEDDDDESQGQKQRGRGRTRRTRNIPTPNPKNRGSAYTMSGALNDRGAPPPIPSKHPEHPVRAFAMQTPAAQQVANPNHQHPPPQHLLPQHPLQHPSQHRAPQHPPQHPPHQQNPNHADVKSNNKNRSRDGTPIGVVRIS